MAQLSAKRGGEREHSKIRKSLRKYWYMNKKSNSNQLKLNNVILDGQ